MKCIYKPFMMLLTWHFQFFGSAVVKCVQPEINSISSELSVQTLVFSQKLLTIHY